jgi:hypothetical protein
VTVEVLEENRLGLLFEKYLGQLKLPGDVPLNDDGFVELSEQLPDRQLNTWLMDELIRISSLSYVPVRPFLLILFILTSQSSRSWTYS